jgi:hypothetical protein
MYILSLFLVKYVTALKRFVFSLSMWLNDLGSWIA